MSIYDDPELKSGGFVSWESVGDEIAGDVIDARKGVDFNGRPCPELVIRTDDGEDRIMTCGQANLKAQILEQKPMPGDRIKVAFVRTEKAEKGQKKVFEVKVASGGAKGTAAAAVPISDEDPFVADAADWMPGLWGEYPKRMLP